MKRRLMIPILVGALCLLILPASAHGCLRYDVNRDGKVDIQDVTVVAKAFGSYPGHPRWKPCCDFDGDYRITLIDVAFVCIHFGEE